MDDITIELATEPTAQLQAGLANLLPQLLNKDLDLMPIDLEKLLAHPGVYFFVAKLADGSIVGAAQITQYPRAYGATAFLDGVVVDEAQRGKGIATKLMDAVIAKAKTLPIDYLALTANPKREAANHVYEKLGFELYDTNYRRLKIS